MKSIQSEIDFFIKNKEVAPCTNIRAPSQNWSYWLGARTFVHGDKIGHFGSVHEQNLVFLDNGGLTTMMPKTPSYGFQNTGNCTGKTKKR